MAHQEAHAVVLATLHEFAREAVGVTRFVLGGVGCAGQLWADVAQRGLDGHRLVGRDHAPVAAQLAHLRGRRRGGVEFLAAGVEVQDALRALVVGDAALAPQLLQRRAAVGAQAHDLTDVVPRARRRALAQELQAPQPLAQVGAQAKQQRRVFLAQPLQDLQRRARVGPGLGMADRDLAAVGKAGLGRRRGLAVDDADFVPLLTKVIGRSDAEQAGAEYDHMHESSPGRGCARERRSRACRSPCPRYLRDSLRATRLATCSFGASPRG